MIFVFVWLTSVSVTISRSIHVAAVGIISFFFTSEYCNNCLLSIPAPAMSLSSGGRAEFATGLAMIYNEKRSKSQSAQMPLVKAKPRTITCLTVKQNTSPKLKYHLSRRLVCSLH